MKKILMAIICVLIVTPTLEAQENDSVESTVGFTVGMMGTGLYYRFVGEGTYLQLTGIYVSSSDNNSSGTQFYSAGASYGWYLHENRDAYIPYGLKFHLGGSYTKTNNIGGTSGGIGFAVEFFNPLSKGLFIEYALDYGAALTDPANGSKLYVGFLYCVSLGYNF